MAYKLENLSSNGQTAGVTFSNVTIGGTVGDYIEFSGSGLSGNSDGGYRLAGNSSGYTRILALDQTRIFFRCENSDAIFTTGYVLPLIGVDFVVRLERVASGVWEAFLDGVSLGTQAISNNFTTNQWLRLGPTATANACFAQAYYFETSVGGVVRTWDANLSNGTGSILPTNDGVNQGTLLNFPIDGSQWVFYATGPNTPINLGSANILANSIRFTWGQG
jgi:hypothetical protein